MSHIEVFYTPPDRIDSSDSKVEIIGEEAHHIRNVLRHKHGDEIVVVDGCGMAYWVTITDIAQDTIIGRITKQEQSWGEARIPVKVIIPILKGQRMDTVIEKGTELGVTDFLVTQTAHSVAEITDNKLERWRRIAKAAMKQCLRSVLPTISPFPSLKAALKSLEQDSDKTYYADMNGGKLLEVINLENDSETKRVKTIIMAVGPEGGFSGEEVGLLDRYGGKSFRLGKRRLRSDTAVIAALSQLQAISN
jgi:16S rRNA (uracil1498-N3)-methyltransferase